MALINCPECGKQISDKAKICIGCGFPTKNTCESVSDEIDMDPQERKLISSLLLSSDDNIFIKFKKNSYIEIKNGIMTVCVPFGSKTTDVIENFILQYFSVSMGINIGFSILNQNKKFYSGVVDVVANKNQLNDFNKLKEIMYKHGLFANRSRFDELYKQDEVTKEIINKKIQSVHSSKIEAKNENFNGIYRYSIWNGKTEVYCPRCQSENCSYYTEQKIIPGKTKTSYTANLNPLKPFTLVNKKEKVLRKDKAVTESKIICNDCGKIFI